MTGTKKNVQISEKNGIVPPKQAACRFKFHQWAYESAAVFFNDEYSGSMASFSTPFPFLKSSVLRVMNIRHITHIIYILHGAMRGNTKFSSTSPLRVSCAHQLVTKNARHWVAIEGRCVCERERERERERKG